MSDHSENSPLRVGEVFLEKYQILGVLGRGGQGCVYRALNLFMGREVAIKIISSQGGLTEELRQRGQQEAALLGKLSHPHLVRVFDAGISDAGNMYIVMELLEGQTLAHHLRDAGQVTVPEGLRLVGELCDALACAHEVKAVHRDLKPANIFLTTEGTPKVLDFGVAKIAGAVGFQTQKNMVVGTILYMSPEQLRGEPATPRSDIYALGLIAFQLFYGGHPLLLDEVDLENCDRRRLAWLQAKKPAPRLDSLIQGFPEYVARMVNTAIVKPPGRRFESARHMGNLARKYLLRYEEEVSQGHKVPPPAERKARAPGGSQAAMPGSETERLFALSEPSWGSEKAAVASSEGSKELPADSTRSTESAEISSESMPWGLSEPVPQERSFSSGPATASAYFPSEEGANPPSATPSPEHGPAQSTSTSASVSSAGQGVMSVRLQVGVVASVGFIVGLVSLALMPRPTPSSPGVVHATPQTEIVDEPAAREPAVPAPVELEPASSEPSPPPTIVQAMPSKSINPGSTGLKQEQAVLKSASKPRRKTQSTPVLEENSKVSQKPTVEPESREVKAAPPPPPAPSTPSDSIPWLD